MHRFSHVFTLALVGASLLTAGVSRVAAQDDAFSDLGLPEITVTISATGYQGIPDDLAAGRYLLTVTAGDDVEGGASVDFVKPEGMSPEEFLSSTVEPPTDATPGVDGADDTGSEAGGPPAYFYSFTFAGGTGVETGQTTQVVLDLTPGEWIAWGENPEAPQAPMVVTVTGEMPSDLPEPESSATITMAEYSIEVTEGELTPGPRVVKIANVGAQPHFLAMERGPDDMTDEDIQTVLESEMTGTPDPDAIDPEEDLTLVLFTTTQSTNTVVWVSIDLQAGMYALTCFVPDIEDGAPHAFHGMYNNVIEVSE